MESEVQKHKLENGVEDAAELAETQEDNDTRLLQLIKEQSTNAYYLNSLNWGQIAVKFGGNESAEMLHKRFLSLIVKVRKSRTTEEIVNDALKIVGRPQKPPSAFILFSVKQRPKIKAKNPDITPTELVKKIGTKWHTLAQKKKDRYLRKAKALKAEYQVQKDKWLKSHPEVEAMEKAKKKATSRKRGREFSAFDLFVDVKKASLKDKYPTLDQAGINEKLKRKWDRLKYSKKTKYEQMANEANQPYRKQKRPLTGYILFCKERRHTLHKENPNLNPTEVTQLLGKVWSSLSKDEKDKYNNTNLEEQNVPKT